MGVRHMLGFFPQPSDIAEVSEIVYFRPSFPICHLFRRIRRKLVCHAFCRSTIFRQNLRDISTIWENTWFLEHQKKKTDVVDSKDIPCIIHTLAAIWNAAIEIGEVHTIFLVKLQNMLHFAC
jgi:hypothetical protein